jgi:hypothetical protein
MSKANKVLKVTPILVVDDIAPCLKFWKALGFEKTVSVPGFAILVRDDVEIMYQTRESLRTDLPPVANNGASLTYIEVAALEPIIDKVKPADVVVPRRTTDYGADEIFVREPGGNVIGFAVQSR